MSADRPHLTEGISIGMSILAGMVRGSARLLISSGEALPFMSGLEPDDETFPTAVWARVIGIVINESAEIGSLAFGSEFARMVLQTCDVVLCRYGRREDLAVTLPSRANFQPLVVEGERTLLRSTLTPTVTVIGKFFDLELGSVARSRLLDPLVTDGMETVAGVVEVDTTVVIAPELGQVFADSFQLVLHTSTTTASELGLAATVNVALIKVKVPVLATVKKL